MEVRDESDRLRAFVEVRDESDRLRALFYGGERGESDRLTFVEGREMGLTDEDIC